MKSVLFAIVAAAALAACGKKAEENQAAHPAPAAASQPAPAASEPAKVEEAKK